MSKRWEAEVAVAGIQMSSSSLGVTGMNRGQGREQQRFSQGKLDVLEMKPETDMVWSEELAGRRPRGGAKRKFMDAVEEDRRLADDREEDAGDRDSWKQVIG